MGSIKKQRKKYFTPSHPWQKKRIDEEKILTQDYGFVNKREIWKMTSKLKRFKERAKYLVARNDKQSEIEETQLISKLQKIGLLKAGANIDQILDLVPKDIMERRLQTIVFRKGFAKSMKQARQFITHNHIMVNGVKIKTPSYVVSIEEENNVTFAPTSKISDAEHPERNTKAQAKTETNAEGKKEEKPAKDRRDKKRTERKYKKEKKY